MDVRAVAEATVVYDIVTLSVLEVGAIVLSLLVVVAVVGPFFGVVLLFFDVVIKGVVIVKFVVVADVKGEVSAEVKREVNGWDVVFEPMLDVVLAMLVVAVG